VPVERIIWVRTIDISDIALRAARRSIFLFFCVSTPGVKVVKLMMGETYHAIARTSQICSYVKCILCQQNLTHRQNGKLSVKKALFSASILYRKLPVPGTVCKILPEKRRWRAGYACQGGRSALSGKRVY